MQKSRYVSLFTTNAAAFARALRNLITLREMYFDNELGVGSANEITSEEAADEGTTPAAIASVIMAIEHLGHLGMWLDEYDPQTTAPSVADYRSAFNKVSKDL